MESDSGAARLLQKFAGAERPLGMLVTSLDPAVTDILGATGFDFVLLDNEASPIDPLVALQHVRAAEAHRMIPLVRVLENSPSLIRRFLDVGCQGVVIPHLETALEAESAVAATRFHPRGKRGMCPSCHAARYSPPATPPWVRWHDQDDLLVIPIIESRPALENLPEILDVDGIEIVDFGAGDLSQDLGIPPDEEAAAEMETAWRYVLEQAHARGKYVLGFPYPKATIEATTKLFDDGADGVLHYVDLMLFHELAATITRARDTASRPVVA
jgi:4-hydroxy-2-oxoheptanedioate aldolase